MASIAIARAYQQSFDSHPYPTLAVTNGALNALGDAVAQLAHIAMQPSPYRPQYDVTRTLRFFAFGFGMGPLIGRWNFFLERAFPLHRHASTAGEVSLKQLAKRVTADQLIMAPAGLAMFLSSMGIMEGRDSDHIRGKFGDLYTRLLIANWQVWPLAQLVNFRFMPLPYRVPFQSTCGVFWTLYISLANAKAVQSQDHDDVMHHTPRS